MTEKSTAFRYKGYICTAGEKSDDSVSRLKTKHLMGLRAPPNLAGKKTESCMSV